MLYCRSIVNVKYFYYYCLRLSKPVEECLKVIQNIDVQELKSVCSQSNI